MIPISNLFLEAYEDTTSIATEIYGTDKKTYINTGSGNVFKLAWRQTAAIPNDTIDHFSLVIKRYDPTLNVYYDIFDKNVGLVYSFFVKSDLLPITPTQYILSIYVVAYGKHGSVITSNVINPYVCKGTGTYVNIQPDGYRQSIMKRALAFAKVSTSGTSSNISATMSSTQRTVLTDIDGLILRDSEEKTLITSDTGTDLKTEAELADYSGRTLLDSNGNELFAFATRLLNSTTGWEVMQESYIKGVDSEWHTSYTDYEVLVTMGEWNDAGEPVEVIAGKDAQDNDIYEPLYVL